MAPPGKIQSVYTPSKRGRRERLGQWFLRSAQRSRSKQDGDASPAAEDVASQPTPVIATESAHDVVENAAGSPSPDDGKLKDFAPFTVSEEPIRLANTNSSTEQVRGGVVVHSNSTQAAAVSEPPEAIVDESLHEIVEEGAATPPSNAGVNTHGQRLPQRPIVGTANSREVRVGEPGPAVLASNGIEARLPTEDAPSSKSIKASELGLHRVDDDIDDDALSTRTSILADVRSTLDIEPEHNTTTDLNGGYAPSEASEAETINPYFDMNSDLFGSTYADNEIAYEASHVVSSPLLVVSDQAAVQKIDEEKYWGPTRDMPEDKIVALLTRVVKKSHGTVNANYKVISKHCGSYNCAYILKSNYTDRICVRVPACGFPDRWNAFDGKLLRESALGMRFIRNKTDLPIPRLIDYDITMDNEIETPFIVMSFLSGKPIEEVWPQYEGEDFAATDARRHTILHSLAKTMRLLEPTVFSRYGALLFEGEEVVPSIGDTSRLTTDDIFVIHRKFKPVAFRSSLEDYVHAAKRKLFREHQYPEVEHDHLTRGLFMLWELMLDRFLEAVQLEHGEPNFVLMQSDFNPQNILVDERGNVTGLIDWDCLEAIPRQVGWCSLPHWLKKDWEPEYVWPTPAGTKQILQPHEFDKYRNAYSGYIREACPGKNDSRFTAKSHVYSALLRSGERLDHVKRFVCNVLGDILPRLGGTRDVFISQVGEHGYKRDQQEWLNMRLRDFFGPEACHVCQRSSADGASPCDEGDA